MPFTRRHVPFLEAIAGQVGAAIGRAELFSRVNALAYSDPLTGLGNRRALDQQLEPAVERGDLLAIAFCDLDRLKLINDSLGHEAGDRAIRRAADALAARCARACPARTSIASAATSSASCSRAPTPTPRSRWPPRPAAALARGDAPLALSCGVAELRPGARPTDLFRAADAAQYIAKREGRGRVVVFADEDAGRRSAARPPRAARPHAGRDDARSPSSSSPRSRTRRPTERGARLASALDDAA